MQAKRSNVPGPKSTGFKKNYWIQFTCLFLMSGLLWSCQPQKPTELAWAESLFRIGSQSSPRAVDLNGDGVKDIVMGAGKGEIEDTEYGAFALDGATGKLLWKQSATASIVGSATFADVTNDGISDVFIGGRNANLMALDGKDGSLIWKYQYQYQNDPILQYARFNFYNSVLVPDQNGDQLPDLLTVNGGNWNAAPHSTEDRYPGVLMLISSQDGTIIAADTMPDGKESYLSPVTFKLDNELYLLFGTGGETESGSLYLTTLDDLKKQNLHKARQLATESGHGFIAPPVLTDVNWDGAPDIIAVSHASTVMAFDGLTFKTLWQRKFPGMETSSTPAVGYFTNGRIPDILIVMSEGSWPAYSISKQVLLKGQNGNILYQDSLGCFSLASPVVYDLNHDGYDEAILSLNQYDCQIRITTDVLSPTTMSSKLMAINFKDSSTQTIEELPGHKNIFSTPWIGDLDQDGYLDIVYCQYNNPQNLILFLGMQVKRISTGVRMDLKPGWGEYMGADGKGHFPL